MKEFKIGDSDELITVTKKRWDELNMKIGDLEGVILDLNKGNTRFWRVDTDLHRYDRVVEYKVITNDEALTRVTKDFNHEKVRGFGYSI